MRNCANCKYWDGLRDIYKYKECRRHAPVTLQSEDSLRYAVWPITNEHNWCGEHELLKRDEDESHSNQTQ